MATGLFLCALLPFVASVSFEALNFDDFDYAARNAIVLRGLTWDGVRYACAGTHSLGIWFPLTVLTYLCDAACFGGTPQAFHIGNLFWHGAAAVALFLLLAEILRRRPAAGLPETTGLWCAFFAALFWAVHPLRTESVAWIASRKDLVSGCFGFLGLACWVRSCTTGPAWGKAYWAAMACFALAIMAKPVVMTFPVAALCLEALLTGRVQWRRLALPVLMGMACGLLAIWMQADEHQSVTSLMATPLWQRLANALAALWHYARAIVWPARLACFYPWPRNLDWWSVAAGGTIAAAALGLAIAAGWPRKPAGNRQPARIGLLLAIWFFAALAPTLGLIHFGKHAYADRFTYWPSAAIAAGLALAWLRAAERWPMARSWGGALLASLCVGYGVAAWQNARAWRNTTTVLERACAVTQDNAYAHCMLGMAYAADPSRFRDAVRHLRTSIQILPNSENIGTLALLLAIRAPEAELEQATALAQQALGIFPQEGTARVALGLVALRCRDWQAAETSLAAGAALRGGDPMIWEWLGMARYNLKQYPAAAEAFGMALRKDPANAALRERIRQAEALARQRNEETRP